MTYILRDFPGGTPVKNPNANVGDAGSVAGLGRSLGVGNGNPLQYSFLEDFVDRGAWWATVCRFTELDTTERQSTHKLKIEKLLISYTVSAWLNQHLFTKNLLFHLHVNNLPPKLLPPTSSFVFKLKMVSKLWTLAILAGYSIFWGSLPCIHVIKLSFYFLLLICFRPI